MIHVLADQNLYKIEELIPPQTQLNLYDPSKGIPDLGETDALLIRTVTHLNEDTLPSIPPSLKFIGTGSSGTDHLDNEYFEHKGITLADANGCNARAVAEYVMTALLLWKEEHQPSKSFGKVGVIGVGKAGSAVVDLLRDFDIECVQYDPPREERDPEFKSAPLEDVLDCEILTFHIPLNKKGDHPTFHWLNEEKLTGRKFKLIINAARGGVIDELALMKFYVKGTVENYILDVWEDEPDLNTEVAKHAFIATPHIAGYSEQAKINATKIVCDKLATHFDLDPTISKYKNVSKKVDLAHIKYDLTNILTRLHPIKGYDAALRDLFDRTDKKVLFRNLRNEWPYRYEYSFLKIRAELLDELPELEILGISRL
ncbi:MAG TPA: 4-phosphoerythronate dehydrogenase [Gracilimonas sp.]|uniref:4-phosphoerythronate dehydrogenase n=1 Tax=Gracilimonas sp. TaxID=1974203 RepID=UPI002D9F3892|nr:4-phosphoerythronate dehydrogenase [Gracilimonas sp.]